MSTYKTPGVYTEEISTLPPSVVPVETAVPAFIGYTEKRPSGKVEAYRITSLREYHALFGGAAPEEFSGISINREEEELFFTVALKPKDPGKPLFWLYYQLQMFYANGGGVCYVVPVNTYRDADENLNNIDKAALEDGLQALRIEDEPTLVLLPDLAGIIKPKDSNDDGEIVEEEENPGSHYHSLADYYGVYQNVLSECAYLKDRFAIIDTHNAVNEIGFEDPIGQFRKRIGGNFLSYGAAYYPWLNTTLQYGRDESKIVIEGNDLADSNTNNILNPSDDNDPETADTSEMRLKYDTTDLNSLPDMANVTDKKKHYEARSLYHVDNGAYTEIVNMINSFRLTLPPGGAMAGIYAQVDGSRGVFKAPANVSLSNVLQPNLKISNDDQADLNVHPSGKSVNAIRSFIGKGVLVWGARTLDGNSNEWRYISVRRLFVFLEESIGKAIERFVFEPNNENTWVKVKGTIENFLTDQWRTGALAGSTPAQAFFVNVGLGKSMTPQDILEGRLIVEIGLAAVRPAEFIVLRFSHKLQEA